MDYVTLSNKTLQIDSKKFELYRIISISRISTRWGFENILNFTAIFFDVRRS